MSINIQTANGLKKFADRTTKQNIKNALGYLPLNPDETQRLTSNSDVLTIEDSNGNIAVRVDNDGLSVSKLNIKDSLVIPDSILSDSNSFSIEDIFGNINFKISDNGLETTSVHLNENIYLDDSLIDICDSSGNIIIKISDNGVQTTNVTSNSINTEDIYASSVSTTTITTNTINSSNIDVENTLNALRINSDNINTIAVNSNNLIVSENIEGGNVTIRGELDTHSISADSDSFELLDEAGNLSFKVDKDGLYATTMYSNGDLVATQNYVLSVLSGGNVSARSSLSSGATFATNNTSTMSRFDLSQYLLSPVVSYGGILYSSLQLQHYTNETNNVLEFSTFEGDTLLKAYINIYFNGTTFEITNIKTCKPLEFMSATEADWEHGYAFTIPYIYMIPLS